MRKWDGIAQRAEKEQEKTVEISEEKASSHNGLVRVSSICGIEG